MNLIDKASTAFYFVTQTIRQNPKITTIGAALGAIAIIASYRYYQTKNSKLPLRHLLPLNTSSCDPKHTYPKSPKREAAPKAVIASAPALQDNRSQAPMQATANLPNNFTNAADENLIKKMPGASQATQQLQGKPLPVKTSIPPSGPPTSLTTPSSTIQQKTNSQAVIASAPALPANSSTPHLPNGFINTEDERLINRMLKVAKIAEDINQLPEISLPKQVSHLTKSDDQHNISREKFKNLGPVARFTDSNGRKGIAIHIQEREDYCLTLAELTKSDKISLPEKLVSGVFVAFQANSDNKNLWRISLDKPLRKYMAGFCWQQHLLKQHPDEMFVKEGSCETCPRGVRTGDPVDWPTVFQLLTKTHPVFAAAPVIE